MSRRSFITPLAFDKLRLNGRKTVRGDAEPVEASNHELEVMKPLLGFLKDGTVEANSRASITLRAPWGR